MKKFKILFLVLLAVFAFSSCKSVKTSDIEQGNTTNTDNNIFMDESPTNYQIIGENKIAFSSFSFEIPDDLSLLSDTMNPLAESSDGKFQLMISDKTKSVTNYNEYINSTYSKYESVGLEMSKIETLSSNGLSASRFSLNTTDEENEKVTMIFYFIEQDDLKIDAVIMLKGNEVVDYSEVDNYIATIDFLEN